MSNQPEQELLGNQAHTLLKLLIQPVIQFQSDIGLSTIGQWVSPESPDFTVCEYFIQKSRGLKILAIEWKSKTVIICLASNKSQDAEVRISYEMLKKLVEFS